MQRHPQHFKEKGKSDSKETEKERHAADGREKQKSRKKEDEVDDTGGRRESE